MNRERNQSPWTVTHSYTQVTLEILFFNRRMRQEPDESGRKLRKKDDVLGKKQTRPSCFERIRLKNDVFFGRMRGKKCVFLARTRPISAAYGQNLVFFRRTRRIRNEFVVFLTSPSSI